MKNLFLLPFLVILLAGVLLYGFLEFVAEIEAIPEQEIQANLEKTDAIVVLTGGSERVTTGFELLESGSGKKLFISGVHKKLTLDGLFGTLPITPELRNCCIVLGYHAGSTLGNAEETRNWMQSEDYHSLRLVTANYHMPRSLLLFHASMPEIKIIPHPIAPDSVKLAEWWFHPGTIELLVTEYGKYLMANILVWMNRE